MAKRVFNLAFRGTLEVDEGGEQPTPTPAPPTVAAGEWPVGDNLLTEEQVAEIAARYWPEEQVANAVAIARCESGWNAFARNQRGEDSRGLWQINVSRGAHPGLAFEPLHDPGTNARHAADIWRASGSWRPWLNCARALGLAED